MSGALVFGGSGFIGQNLLNISNQYSTVSLRDPNWKEQVDGSETWINLVGKAHDHKGEAREEDYYYANVQLVKEIFEAFVLSEAKLLIHISSLAAIEEFESDKALSETDDCSPVSWYGKSKRAAEEWLLSQELPNDKKLIILRPPMVHGPGDKGNLGLLYKFISKGIPYPLTAFDNKRSLISIQNFCYFIEQIITHNHKLETGIYHISDDEPMSTREIINVIKEVTGKNIMNLSIPKFLIKGIAKVGDVIPIPLNTKRLKKLTSNLLISNQYIKNTLTISNLPLTAKKGLETTIRSFWEKK
ncbi:NAD-dependent epimerase/dehydratase family protein [Sphingobacterium sp. UDSM-2020]|uniref:NAD-dependent epimerase/dehydratase family protein n=1 Tax=Sphingobacterium sp. UDSM-2020 TaxID=2795738 RepID=UPI001938304E|nr:NAD-dependent epimerase/dehydratase family protein [Sphingobacterium sp. UDSM-2020]QQD15372.1 NAD-dependent epimerase/dehydratase family protein [Sphingobacterium sp. UDSM-2020]